ATGQSFAALTGVACLLLGWPRMLSVVGETLCLAGDQVSMAGARARALAHERLLLRLGFKAIGVAAVRSRRLSQLSSDRAAHCVHTSLQLLRVVCAWRMEAVTAELRLAADKASQAAAGKLQQRCRELANRMAQGALTQLVAQRAMTAWLLASSAAARAKDAALAEENLRLLSAALRAWRHALVGRRWESAMQDSAQQLEAQLEGRRRAQGEGLLALSSRRRLLGVALGQWLAGFRIGRVVLRMAGSLCRAKSRQCQRQLLSAWMKAARHDGLVLSARGAASRAQSATLVAALGAWRIACRSRRASQELELQLLRRLGLRALLFWCLVHRRTLQVVQTAIVLGRIK
ncbi:unnamed protein product, partial [Polarella glacialis]